MRTTSKAVSFEPATGCRSKIAHQPELPADCSSTSARPRTTVVLGKRRIVACRRTLSAGLGSDLCLTPLLPIRAGSFDSQAPRGRNFPGQLMRRFVSGVIAQVGVALAQAAWRESRQRRWRWTWRISGRASKAGDGDAMRCCCGLRDARLRWLDVAKADVVARTKNQWVTNEIGDLKVVVHGDSAIVTGSWTGKGTDATEGRCKERWRIRGSKRQMGSGVVASTPLVEVDSSRGCRISSGVRPRSDPAGSSVIHPRSVLTQRDALPHSIPTRDTFIAGRQRERTIPPDCSRPPGSTLAVGHHLQPDERDHLRPI